jgi:ribulose-phosphate 3-epimerase
VTVRIAPSILAADFGHLADQIASVASAGADLIHVDIMDGHFVPNITFGPLVVEAIKRSTNVPLDVHLMIADPDRYLEAFVTAGASMVSVHAEAVTHLHRTIGHIKTLGARAGVAINPATPAAMLVDVVADLDHVLVMSVNPGFTGQAFIPHSLQKVADVRAIIDARGGTAAIEVDGGVDRHNARGLVRAGASILVAGAAVFHAPDVAAAVAALRHAAEGR